MSLINRVLLDLENRRGQLEGHALPNEVRALPRENRRRLWPLPASLAVMALAGWLLWPAFMPPSASRDGQAVTAPREAVPVPATLPKPASAPPSAADATAVVLRRAMTLATTPMRPASASAAPPAPVPLAVAAASPAPLAPETAPSPRADAAPVVLNKEVRAATPRDRASGEYAKAIAQLNLGHLEPAIAAFRAAMREDSGWAVPRQALLGVLLEAKRLDEAEVLLRQALAERPGQVDVAMQLARIQVEKKDFAAAADTLAPVAGQAAGNAEYFALDAAVLQRLGRSREAVSAYDKALRLTPERAVWWLGLGISLEADGRGAEASQAYQRARDSGTLTPDLAAFVAQKLSGN
jgi:MSHA biogenesis protein MshN